MALSHLSETLIGSEIIGLAARIREKMAQGQQIRNFTIGDFDPEIFPIPAAFEEAIVRAYREHHTNYPPGDGLPALREAVSAYLEERAGMRYDPAGEVLISAGGRPLIYATYRAIVDHGEGVVYAVPSWNNNHYTHFVEGDHRVVEARPEHDFMPVAAELAPLLPGATLLALCSPQNPTGTAFRREQLEEICDLVLQENASRGPEAKKLYILFDQMYWQLTYGETRHYHPVGLRPALKPYTIYIDGMSKAFAATGVRVGWATGPAAVIGKMKAILSHIGAWSPMAEQHAAAAFLPQGEATDRFLEHFREELHARLQGIYDAFPALREEGHPVDAIAPQAALYLTIRLDLKGRRLPGGQTLTTQQEVTDYVLQEAGLAVVPFYAFGASRESPWYRLSVGTCRREDIPLVAEQLRRALTALS